MGKSKKIILISLIISLLAFGIECHAQSYYWWAGVFYSDSDTVQWCDGVKYAQYLRSNRNMVAADSTKYYRRVLFWKIRDKSREHYEDSLRSNIVSLVDSHLITADSTELLSFNGRDDINNSYKLIGIAHYPTHSFAVKGELWLFYVGDFASGFPHCSIYVLHSSDGKLFNLYGVASGGPIRRDGRFIRYEYHSDSISLIYKDSTIFSFPI